MHKTLRIENENVYKLACANLRITRRRHIAAQALRGELRQLGIRCPLGIIHDMLAEVRIKAV